MFGNKISNMNFSLARVSIVVGVSLYSKFGKVFVSELDRDATVDGNPKTLPCLDRSVDDMMG